MDFTNLQGSNEMESGDLELDPLASSDSGVNSSVRNAIENFDENFINESLESLNPFLTKRLFEKTQNVLILDMTPNGESEYKEISLRNLLNKINELSPIDNRGSKRGLVIPVHYRDLRRLDFHLNPVANPTILVRRHCVLMLLDPLRAIVMSNRFILLVPDGADSLIQILETHMKAWTKTKNSLTTISKLVPSSNLNNSSCNFKVEIPDRGNIGSSCSDATSRTLPTIVTSGCFREKPFVSGGSVDAGVSIIKASLVEGGKQPAHAAVNSSDKYCYGTITYEYHAYEAIFATAIALYKQDYSHISRISEELIPQMQRGGIFPFDIQKQMAFLKNKVSTALSRARAFQVCLNTLIDDDESMSLMSLTLLSEKPNLYEVSGDTVPPEVLDTHEDMEGILESYLMDVHTLITNMGSVQSHTQHTEEMIGMQLDYSLNQLLKLNTIISLYAAAIGTGGYVAGLFGMNLNNTTTIQNIPYLFEVVCYTSATAALLGFIALIKYLTVTGVLPKTRKYHKKKMLQ